ncbi:MAG: hypothetical protein K2Y71_10090 [Xanthobacteraceae bacterium]|nr:hypothetical protein [Xanthobacteraceae bacterium]
MSTLSVERVLKLGLAAAFCVAFAMTVHDLVLGELGPNRLGFLSEISKAMLILFLFLNGLLVVAFTTDRDIAFLRRVLPSRLLGWLSLLAIVSTGGCIALILVVFGLSVVGS